MKTAKLILIIFLMCQYFVKAQVGIGTTNPQEELDVNGAVKIGNTTSTNSGTIRWTGTEFQGYDGTSWNPLVAEWTDAGTYVSPADGTTEDVTIGGSNNTSARLTVRSDKTISGLFTNTGTQDSWMIGVNTFVTNNSTNASSITVGNYNDIDNNGTGKSYGTFNRFTNNGTGDKIGTYNRVESAAAGKHYAVWGEALKIGSYAGYFLGDVSIGTNSSNAYILPATRGGAGAVIMIDGFGKSFWTDPNTLGFWNVTGNSGTTDGTNFIGTTDNVNLRFRTNNIERFEMAELGFRFLNASDNISIGSTDFAGNGGIGNIMIGRGAGGGGTGEANISIGLSAIALNTSGSNNIALGDNSLYNNTEGSDNIALGEQSLIFNTTGINNIALGKFSLANNLTASGNIAIGTRALSGISMGVNNIAIGDNAGANIQTIGVNIPSKNIFIGNNIDSQFPSESELLNIGNLLFGKGLDGIDAVISSGNIGIGVPNPLDKLHVAGSLRIVDGTQGAGKFLQSDVNGSTSWVNLSGISVDEISDADSDTKVQVEATVDEDIIRFNTSGSTQMLIDPTGKVGINTLNPQDQLDVSGIIRIATTTTNAAQLRNDENFNHLADNNLDFGDPVDAWMFSSRETTNETSGIFGDRDFVTIWSPADSNRMIRFLDEDFWGDNDGNPYNNSAELAYVDATGQFVQASDKNRKQNIQKIPNALQKMEQINGYTYEYKLSLKEKQKGNTPVKTSGVLAQELYEVLPEAVQISENGEYFVHYAGIIPLLIEAIKEQQKEISELKKLEEHIIIIENKLNNK